MKLVEKSYVNGGGQKEDEGALDQCEITVYPMFDAPYKVPVVPGGRARQRRSGDVELY